MPECVFGPHRPIGKSSILQRPDRGAALSGFQKLDVSELVEKRYSSNEERISYFNLGLARGQSRFTVVDPLRDDLLLTGRCCHVGTSGEPWCPGGRLANGTLRALL